MAKRETKPKPADVQRESMKRSQPKGKQRAKSQARKVATSQAAPTQVHLGANTRRGFVFLLIGLVLAVLFVSLFQGRTGWLAALNPNNEPNSSATQIPNQTQASALAPPQISDTENLVGIVSGHKGNDSGAVCKDGLTEAQVNFEAATRVASLLRAQGYIVDILDEFDPRLKGYKARALLSIHADSCEYINDLATGYKVARFLYSNDPDVEDKLVKCVSAHYRKNTGLRFHAPTVTHNMTEYHAFREIDPNTPGAIIELGFMFNDRDLLTKRKDDVAKGIADGMLCFLRNETLPATATPK